MSEVHKKKKKKRHHSGSASDTGPPAKQIKVEISDSTDDKIEFSMSSVGLNCDSRQKKKKKKNHHSQLPIDTEPPSEQMNVKINDSADDSLVNPAPVVGLNFSSSVVENQQKKSKKHKRCNSANNITGRRNEDVIETSSSCQNITNVVSVTHPTYITGLDRRSSESLTHDSSRQLQSLGSSISELRCVVYFSSVYFCDCWFFILEDVVV